MHFSNWLVFCGVTILVTFSPGPGVLLAMSNALSHGMRRTVMSSLGNASGLIILSALAMAGMGAVLAVSAMAFTVLKISGALYLMYLGVKQWCSKAVLLTAVTQSSSAPAKVVENRKLYLQGLGVALTNPKAILFFSALFPQFVSPEAPMLAQVALLTLTFIFFSLLSHLFYVLLARVFKRQLAQPRKQKIFNRASGGLFVLLGLGLLRLHNSA